MSYCILNGALTKTSEAAIPIDDRGFRYGDSVFETIAIHNGVPYQFDWHMQRLSGGLKAIKIAFDTAPLKKQCQHLLRINKVKTGILRIQVSRGVGSLGYLSTAKQPIYVIQVNPIPVMNIPPVALWKSTYQKISAKALPVQYKLGQGLNSILARLEASENEGTDDHGCADALLLNEQGHICETSSGNIFWLKNGTLYTPSLACGVLEGSTRHAIMRLSTYLVVETQAPIEALLEADAVFITNVVWPIIAVGALFPGLQIWNSTATAEQFRTLLTHDRETYSQKHKSDW